MDPHKTPGTGLAEKWLLWRASDLNKSEDY